MERTQIKLQAPEEVKEFVSAAEKCNFDIDVVYNKILIDAKSFLGVLSLSTNPMTVVCHGEDLCFLQVCEKYAYQ